MSKIKAKLAELSWWVVKWTIAATVVIVALNVFSRLQRQVLLTDALVNWIQQQQQVLQQNASEPPK